MSKKLKYCPTCGSDKIEVVIGDFTTVFHGRSIKMEDFERQECPCGEKVYSAESIRRIEQKCRAKEAWDIELKAIQEQNERVSEMLKDDGKYHTAINQQAAQKMRKALEIISDWDFFGIDEDVSDARAIADKALQEE